MDIGNIAPYMVFGALALLVVAGLYAQYLQSRGDTAGDILHDKVEWAAHLVMAAEQHLKTAANYERYAWAFDELRKRFPDTDEDEARTLIESQVYQMNASRPVIIESNGPIDDRGGELWLSGRQN